MIPATVVRILEAFRVGVSAARAVLAGRAPVLVDDVLAAEGCECETPRVAVVHDDYTRCGDLQHRLMHDAAIASGDRIPARAITEIRDQLAEEADRRDGVRRGPR